MSWTIMAVSASKTSSRPVAILGAVDGEVVEAEGGVQRRERLGVAGGEAGLELAIIAASSARLAASSAMPALR